MEEAPEIINTPLISVLSFLFVLFITIITVLPIQIFQFIIGNILSVLILSVAGIFLTKLSFILLVELILSISLVLSLILDFPFLKETCVTMYNSTKNKMRFSRYILKDQINNENSFSSPGIFLNHQKYVVVEYGTYKFNPTDEGKLTGFLILNYNEGAYIKDADVREKVLKVHLMWRHIYFKKALGKDVKISRTTMLLIKNRINFQKKLNSAIEKWSKNNYEKARKMYDAEFIEVLKKLDQEVLDQYPILIEKLEHQVWVMQNIYALFEKPSYESYQQLYQKIERIQELGAQENQIWSKRLSTWSKLCSYRELKIKQLPGPNLKLIFGDVLGDLVTYYFSKSQPPISGATISRVLTETAGKKINKEGRRLINTIFVQHMFGIDAIRKNMEINQRFKEVRNEYRQIWNNPPITKIRH